MSNDETSNINIPILNKSEVSTHLYTSYILVSKDEMEKMAKEMEDEETEDTEITADAGDKRKLKAQNEGKGFMYNCTQSTCIYIILLSTNIICTIVHNVYVDTLHFYLQIYNCTCNSCR